MRVFSAWLLLLVAFARVGSAQQLKPIPAAVFDIRGFHSGLGQDPVTAATLGVAPTDLPSSSLGAVAGLHVYPLRRGGFAFGLGAEAMIARGRSQQQDATTGDPVGEPITQKFMSFSPQISLNFGHRNGWSYVSAGLGPSTFATYQGETAPTDPPLRSMTPNFGGGARWFSSSHLAFCFDVRFYQTVPAEATIGYPPRQRSRVLVLSAGIALR